MGPGGHVNGVSRLAPGRLGARYRRLRWACDLGERVHELDDDDAFDGDSYEDDDWRHCPSPLDDVIEAVVRGLHAAGFAHRLPLPAAPRSCAPRREPSLVREGLEARVWAHFEALIGRGVGPIRDAGWARDEALLSSLAERLHGVRAASLAALLLMRPLWVRPLEHWQGRSLDSLVEHLLVAYAAPRFLLRAWSEPVDVESLRWMAWLIVLGQGGSLPRMSELAHASDGESWARVPSKLAAALARVPDSLPPREGILLAEILRLGGSEREFELLRRDPSFVLDFAGPIDASELEFWRGTVSWLVRRREDVDDSTPAILAWARHEQTERVRMGRGFEWRGRTWASARRDALAYQATFARPWQRSLSWKPRGWDWQGEVGGATWTIGELTSSAALRAESQAMSHCVHGYDLSCWRGDSAIFSLCREGKRCVTIELRPADRTVAQAKRAYNQTPSPLELEVIAGWLSILSIGDRQRIA